MSKDAQKPEEGQPKKSKKKLIIIVLAAVLLLGGGGAGGYFFFFAKGSGEPAPPEPGEVVALDSITLNLAEGHYLKLSFALQATLDAKETPDGSKALDIAISQFSNRTVAELASSTAREKAKAELKDKISKAYHGEVIDVYFTEFVMQ